RDFHVTGVQTCALPILLPGNAFVRAVILAIPSAAVMFALFAAVFAAASIEKLPFAALLAIKIVIGIAVPLVVTPLAVRDALSPEIGRASCRERVWMCVV